MASNPYRTYNFVVLINYVLVGTFTEVTGLEISTEVEEIEEGGVNNYTLKFPKQSKHSTLVFKRGIGTTQSLFLPLYTWYENVLAGDFDRMDGTIYMYGHDGYSLTNMPIKWWDFYDAYPIRWKGPDFDAMDTKVAVEEVELVHHGLEEGTASQITSALVSNY